MDNDAWIGPFVKAAFLCEKVLEEKDNVVSAIRIFDRTGVDIEIGGSPPDAGDDALGIGIALKGDLFVALVAGHSPRKRNVTVLFRKPDRTTSVLQEFPIEFPEGEDAAVQLNLRLDIGVHDDGLYWFEIVVDEATLTRVPLRLSKVVRRLP